MAKGHRQDELIVGLDIGTTKVCCIIGEVTEEGVDIIGIGTHASKGLAKGVVINIDATAQSIKHAVEEAELMAGVEVARVYAGIAGAHIKGFNSNGIVPIKENEVTVQDVARVVDAARAVAIPMDREILHVIPQEYIIDGQGGIKEPIGMSGVRLEAKVHIVTGATTSAQNVSKCAKRCGLEVGDLVLEQVASAEAVLSDDEKELGVAVVDIGGGTTDIAVFVGGSVVHTSVLTLGGHHLTNDIAVGLRTPLKAAELIKQRYGCALVEKIGAEEVIQVPSVGGRPPRTIQRQILGDIIEPRVEEIFALVAREIQLSGYEDKLGSGVVITGGSTALAHIDTLAEHVLGRMVRIGSPRNVGGLVDVVQNPKFSTAVGLVQYGAQADAHRYLNVQDERGGRGIADRLRDWINELF